TNAFSDIDADQLTLWRVSIPDDDEQSIQLNLVSEKEKLKATTKLFKVFDTDLPDDTIHIVVQRPPQVTKPHNEKRPSLGFRNTVICWTLA
ncbi:hypothetical protein BGZ47_004876, partial [Haplosporangium gracile]